MANRRMGYASPVGGMSYGEWRREGILKNQLKKRKDLINRDLDLESMRQAGQTKRTNLLTAGQANVANINNAALSPLRTAQSTQAVAAADYYGSGASKNRADVQAFRYDLGKARKEDAASEVARASALDRVKKDKKKASILQGLVPQEPEPTFGRFLWDEVISEPSRFADYFARVFNPKTYMR